MIWQRKIALFSILGLICFEALVFVYIEIPSSNKTQTQDSHTILQKYPPNLRFKDSSPKSSYYNLTISDCQLNVSEACVQQFGWTPVGNTNIFFNTPSEYNQTTAQIELNIMNGTVLEQIVESDFSGDLSRYEQAQAFNITEGRYLSSFSFYSGGSKPFTTIIEIRNNTYEGEILRNVSVTLLTGWTPVYLTPLLFLKPGKYFIRMGQSTSPFKAWYKSADNNTETWINNAGNWEPANFDLTLKVNTTSAVDPAAVNMSINKIPVNSEGLGLGNITISSQINGTFQNYTVNANQSVIFAYQINATYYRFTNALDSYVYTSTTITWNFSLNMVNPGGTYLDYSANITGFQPDHTNIRIYLDQTMIGYDPINSSTINTVAIADRLLFDSPNHISDVIIPESLSMGSTAMIDVSVLGLGNTSIQIEDDSQILYQNNSINNLHPIFWWYINESNPITSAMVHIHHLGTNEIGHYDINVTILNNPILEASPIKATALGILDIQCRYFNELNGISISGADIDFSLASISSTLSQNGQNYSKSIDLNQNALLPGNYSLGITSQKSGYSPEAITVPVEIVHRPITLNVTQNAKQIYLNDFVTFKINAMDTILNEPLMRPINLSIDIIGSNATQTNISVYNIIIRGVIQNAEFVWDPTENIAYGNYDVKITVQSDFYTSELYLPRTIAIVENKNNLFILIPSIIGGLALATTGFVVVQKQRVKKSTRGLIILHERGVPLAFKTVEDFTKIDPVAISGAISGIITLIKEITGKGLRTLETDEGYVNIIHGQHCWLVIFFGRNPFWIPNTTRQCLKDIETRFGKKIADYNGEIFEIPIDEIIHTHFKTQFVITHKPVNEPKKPNKELLDLLIN